MLFITPKVAPVAAHLGTIGSIWTQVGHNLGPKSTRSTYFSQVESELNLGCPPFIDFVFIYQQQSVAVLSNKHNKHYNMPSCVVYTMAQCDVVYTMAQCDPKVWRDLDYGDERP